MKFVDKMHAVPLNKVLKAQSKELEETYGREAVDAAMDAVKSDDNAAPAPGFEKFYTNLKTLKGMQKEVMRCGYLREDYLECLHGHKQQLRQATIYAREQELKKAAQGGGDHH